MEHAFARRWPAAAAADQFKDQASGPVKYTDCDCQLLSSAK